MFLKDEKEGDLHQAYVDMCASEAYKVFVITRGCTLTVANLSDGLELLETFKGA